MRFSSHIFTLTTIGITGVCSDFLGPRFPAPVDFASNGSLVAAGWRNLSSTFDAYIDGSLGATPKILDGLDNLTFSIGMFSIHDPAAQSLQYHHTSDEVKNGPGADEVDGDSIYRVASISKLITTYAGMLEFKDGQWDKPITDFVPSLSKSSLDKVGNDLTRDVQWEDVTLRALAAQIAGVPRTAQPWSSDLLFPNPTTGMPTIDPAKFGLPPLNFTDATTYYPCAADYELFLKDPLSACPADLYFHGGEARPPSFQPWTTPGYANNGFILLGIALANITGKPIAQVYHDTVFSPLSMTNSNSSIPPESEWSHSVIAGDDPTQWEAPGGISISSGGLFSSLNDLSKFGTALMNSTLLPADKTREWMKPVSHTASRNFSVGAPWEIYRYTHENTGAVTDIYTKLGDSGHYAGFVTLVPDYDAGFIVLSASTNETRKSILAATIADLITTTMLPILEAEAAMETKCNFAGTYESKNPDLNSSLTLMLNDTPTNPGLYISSWTNNSTDMMPLLPDLLGYSTVKLQPSIQEPGKVAFRAVPVLPEIPAGSFLGPFLGMQALNGDWLVVDDPTYGGIALSLFLFDVGADGKATTASPAATRTILARVR
ncbi:uncharacterized protein BP5553_04217 [Venustampulla echinocandica]|uniref:Uncharacterized protein n=1 Tax=Venustampulla echinocandica TaxID=2656787 RepID=A0A370TWI0_9HELO|nr:uncharacterized protein BP5553_04217 [Venustampulla echinocandica]RDL39877.1 hypothetical protein BP5553_04217 [Venustampulla echinocandica]